MPVFLSALGVLLVGAVIYYLSSPANEAEANIALKHKDATVWLGRVVYAENCIMPWRCTKGQANWRQRMQMVIFLRHRMMKQDTLAPP